MNSSLFSSKSDLWETPQWLFDELNKEFHFDIDVCATYENRKCGNWLGSGPGKIFVDGLRHRWMDMTCWMNPPYSQLKKWIKKASEEAQKGATVVCLLPARTDTIAFHEYIWDRDKHHSRPGVEVRFLKGRLKFVGAKSSAPFPSMIVIFRGRSDD